MQDCLARFGVIQEHQQMRHLITCAAGQQCQMGSSLWQVGHTAWHIHHYACMFFSAIKYSIMLAQYCLSHVQTLPVYQRLNFTTLCHTMKVSYFLSCRRLRHRSCFGSPPVPACHCCWTAHAGHLVLQVRGLGVKGCGVPRLGCSN